MKIRDRFGAMLYRKKFRGATWFHHVICGGGRIEAKTKHGLILSLTQHEYVDGFILRDGFYEEEVLDAVLARLQPGEVFWDVGANLGEQALTVKKLRPDCSVCAVEPNPQMAALIRQAAARNHLAVTLVEAGLSDVPGTFSFYVYPDNAGRGSLFHHDNAGLPTIQVQTMRGSELIASGLTAPPNVIKLDVEGSELPALLGMAEILRGPDLHTIVFEDGPSEDTPVKRLLLESGFRISSPLLRKGSTHDQLENCVAVKVG